MVRSENFNNLIAMIVGSDKNGVILFMRSQGININIDSDAMDVVKVLYPALTSDVFRANFSAWADDRFNPKANAMGMEKMASGFDPMATQGSGQEFDAMSSQQGANLKEDGFANASGEFDAMDSQSGGFSPMETQYANIGGLFNNDNPYDPNAPVGTTGTKGGNILRDLGGIGGILDKGIDFWKQKETSDATRDTINAGIKAKELDLKIALEQGRISSEQYAQQLELARLNKNAPQSTVVFWVIGGVVLLGALGTAIYFGTRKK